MADNPFSDLIPADKKQENPFGDLIPKEPGEREQYYGGSAMEMLKRSPELAMEMLKNAPESAAGLAGDLWNAVSNPVDTAQAVGGLAESVGNKLGRNVAELVHGQEMEPMPEHSEAAANAVGQAMKDRYGSIENIRRTLVEDPVGAGLDVSGLGMGAAGLVPKLGAVARSVEPVTGSARAVRNLAAKAIPDELPATMYERASKMAPRALDREQRQRMVQTALDEGVLPMSKGVAKVQDRIAELGSELDASIAQATAAGTEVPVSDVMRYVGQLREGLKVGNVREAKDLAKVDKLADDFYRRRWADGRTTMTPDEVQTFKKKTYELINHNRKSRTGPLVQEEFYKTMGRGAKDSIEELVPQAKGLNQEMGKLLELVPELKNVANRLDNNNIVSLRDIGNVAGGGAAAGPGGVFAGALLSVAQGPKFQARMALALNKMKNKDVKWLKENAGAPEVAAAMALAGRTEETVTSDGRSATQ